MTTQLYNIIDVEDFIRKQIETKAIVIIDEIDKLANPVHSGGPKTTSKASDEGVQYDLLPLLDGTQIAVNSSNSCSLIKSYRVED